MFALSCPFSAGSTVVDSALPPLFPSPPLPSPPPQLLHEEIAWAWVLNHQDVAHRKTILANAWFLFDIMVSHSLERSCLVLAVDLFLQTSCLPMSLVPT